MDYVVFGIGFGATILVLGLLLRDFGPRLRFRRSSAGGDVLGAEELVAKVSWTRFCTALGSVLALAGAAFLLLTLVSMVLVVSDDTGLWVMSSALGVLLIVIAYWTWAYFHRFGSYGILPERVEPEPAFTETRPAPQRERPQDYPGPPPPGSDDEDLERDAPDAAELEPESDDVPASEAGEPEDDETLDHETEIDSGEEGERTEQPPRIQTPEERLALSESPIDHGSAEGDLDLAASGPRRPGLFGPRRDTTPDPETAESSDEEPEIDENRADA